MKRTDFKIKTKEMINRNHKERIILTECMRLFDSGGVNCEEYENDYMLPKTIITVALENVAFQYLPYCKEDKKVVKNLRHF